MKRGNSLINLLAGRRDFPRALKNRSGFNRMKAGNVPQGTGRFAKNAARPAWECSVGGLKDRHAGVSGPEKTGFGVGASPNGHNGKSGLYSQVQVAAV